MARTDIVKVSGTTPEQRIRWRRAAGMSLAAWMRQAADRAASGIDGSLTAEQVSDLEAALRGIRRDLNRGVGNNVNQVATALNTDLKAGRPATAVGHEADLAAAAVSIEGIRDEIRAALSLLGGLRT